MADQWEMPGDKCFGGSRFVCGVDLLSLAILGMRPKIDSLI